MKKTLIFTTIIIMLLAVMLITGCSTEKTDDEAIDNNDINSGTNDIAELPTPKNGQKFSKINAKQAKEIIDNYEDAIILDVRTKQEYLDEHIVGATLLTLDYIERDASTILPDKDAIILVYCRSGNRSNQASIKLANLGYTNIIDFGGINSWSYETESSE